MLRPLQATADRVTKQVEEFAKAMDKFVTTRGSDDETLWSDALLLLEAYSSIATNRRGRTSTSDPDAQIQKIQLEADLWFLVKNILSISTPNSANREKIAQESRLGDLNRYSTGATLWEAFLDSDAVAQDYECILDWLQEREINTGTPMDEIVRILNAKSNRGEGIWSAGPMYTQAAVKKQKRTRVLSTPLDSSVPGLRGNHTRSSDCKPLVSQLDPDAQTREHAVLQEEDEFHEQAAWRTYWEMLRRGQTPGQIQAWWAERKENWRYAELCGSPFTSTKMPNSPWLRIISIASNPEWVERCEVLSQDMSLDEYQRAVYGMISGNVSSSEPINQTIDDHLFAIFNALLIERYRAYLQAYQTKLTHSGATTYHPQAASKTQLQRFFTEALSSEESRQPHKFLELAIVSKNFTGFLLDMGRAAAQVAHQNGLGSHLIQNDTTAVNELAQINVQDPDTVRFVAHLQLVLQSLGLLESSFSENEYTMENNIASYIAWLEAEGKFSLIPLYVAKLSRPRGEHVLASILVNITNDRERELQVKLIKQYNLDISAIAYGVFTLANYDAIQRLRSADGPPTASRITEPKVSGKPGQLKMKRHLMGGEISAEEEKAIRSVEWYRFVDAQRWGSAAWSVSLLYKIFLYEGRFAALRQLLARVRLAEVSLSAVGMNLLFADKEPPVEEMDLEDGDTDEERVISASPVRKRKSSAQDHILTRTGSDRATLALKSRIWKELEELVAIIDGLEGFHEIVDDLDE
jgi:nuclear pore complex protein Nup107